MDRSSLPKFIIFGLGLFLLVQFVLPKLTGGNAPAFQPLGREGTAVMAQRPAETTCTVTGDRFKAELTSQGAALKHMKLDGAKYTVDGRPTSQAMDIITTPDVENRRSLRTEFRGPDANSQVDYDLVDWKVEPTSNERQCVFSYEDSKVALEKVVRAAGRPFELEVEMRVKNKAPERLRHRASIENVAWRTDKELEASMGRQVPFTTQVECLNNGKLEEFTSADFEPKDFSDGAHYIDGWRVSSGNIDFAATSNYYFVQALVPTDGPAPATCQTQIEDRFDQSKYATRKDDPMGGAMYRSRLTWPAKELGPNETATYKAIEFVGPKEREVLATAAGGTRNMASLIRLGTFAPIARGLVWFLVQCHKLIGSWGVSIVLLTLSVRALLFPLQWKAIKSGGKMRLLKPELDELNARYADDPQQKQLATMELWKKHDVNPLGGCLPMLVQMPVWLALYTSLQTAAELYHVPFLWLKDLSAPDTFLAFGHEIPFILPVLLGVTSFVQQKIMPASGMDPAQQKMMSTVMPLIFTGMMLFLPSGLGVYMFTNSLLGIIQQIAVERYYTSQQPTPGGGSGGITVREKTTDEGGGKRDALAPLGKDKARV